MTAPFAVHVRWEEYESQTVAFVGRMKVGSIHEYKGIWCAYSSSGELLIDGGTKPEACAAVEAWAVEYLGGRENG
jgi:hypothetical protein